MYILVTILSTLRFFCERWPDKTITDLEGCNDDLSQNNIFGGRLCSG